MNSLKKMRRLAKLSQTEIATRLNIKQNTVSNWETGRRNPSPKQLKALAIEYRCTVDDLLKDEIRTD